MLRARARVGPCALRARPGPGRGGDGDRAVWRGRVRAGPGAARHGRGRGRGPGGTRGELGARRALRLRRLRAAEVPPLLGAPDRDQPRAGADEPAAGLSPGRRPRALRAAAPAGGPGPGAAHRLGHGHRRGACADGAGPFRLARRGEVQPDAAPVRRIRDLRLRARDAGHAVFRPAGHGRPGRGAAPAPRAARAHHRRARGNDGRGGLFAPAPRGAVPHRVPGRGPARRALRLGDGAARRRVQKSAPPGSGRAHRSEVRRTRGRVCAHRRARGRPRRARAGSPG